MSQNSFIDASKKHEFEMLLAEGKVLAAEGKLLKSLQKFECAKKICATTKVLRRIEKLKTVIKSLQEEEFNYPSESKCSSLLNKSPVSPVQKSEDHLKSKKAKSEVLNDIKNLQKSSIETVNAKSAPSLESIAKFKELKEKAKTLSYDGRLEEALKLFNKALKIWDCPNVKRYMQEIELVLTNDTQEKNHESSPEVSRCSMQQESYSVTTTLPENPQQNLLSDEEKMVQIKALYKKSRDLAAEGKLMEALKLLKDAQNIQETEKVRKRIENLEQFIAENESSNQETDSMVEIADGLSVYHEIYKQLYPYQRDGVAWMWQLYKKGKGGVLGDDMGLGKTFQVIAFLSAVFDADLVKHVLIIMPVSLLLNWKKEFNKWCPGISVYDYHGSTKKERERNLLRVQRRGYVLITSYGMVVNNLVSLTNLDGETFIWDYVILDEGHKIKNPTRTTKAVHSIPSRNRLVLTGTPVQNNLKELWSLYDFAHQGGLLGSLKTFKMQVEIPITRSREKDASFEERKLGTKLAESLKSLIKPYFLRRTKEEIWGNTNDSNDIDNLGAQLEDMRIAKLESRKNDLILWVIMSQPQTDIYSSFLISEDVKRILMTKQSPLVELTTLKKICDHPRLLSRRACLQLGLNGEIDDENVENLNDEINSASSIDNVTDESLLLESGKLQLVIKLLENLHDTGHKTLVFSLSRKILDMIHRILANKNWKIIRLDGSISKIEERERRIQTFQRDPSYKVFLLTTQVGGVGITLTAADRVIIYDPSWNPATDAQAVDRVYRIGQSKDVVVYRLVTCGTVEEKIYRRQIFKDSITRQATSAATDPYRYFSKQELRELFTLEDPHYSVTQVQLSEMHSSERQADNELEKQIMFLKTLNIFGISDHDLMYKNVHNDCNSEDNYNSTHSAAFIERQVEEANKRIQAEASVTAEGLQIAGTYFKPYQEVIPLPKKSTKYPYAPPVIPDVIDLTESAQDQYSSYQTSKNESPTPEDNVEFHSEMIEDDFKRISRQFHSRKSLLAQNQSPYFLEMQPKTNSIQLHENCKKEDRSDSGVMKNSHIQVKSHEKCSIVIPDEMLEGSSEGIELASKPEPQFSASDRKVPAKEDGGNEPLTFASELQEKVQNLAQLMMEDLDYDEVPQRTCVKNSRVSCARRSTVYLLDSDSSRQSSCIPSANTSFNLAEESESSDDSSSGEAYSPNSASVSFVPESSSSTPNLLDRSKNRHSLRDSVLESSAIVNESFSNTYSGSIRRITPLKVKGNVNSPDSAFAKALAASPILKTISHHAGMYNVDNKQQLNDSDDSPIKMQRIKKCIIESDTESEGNVESGQGTKSEGMLSNIKDDSAIERESESELSIKNNDSISEFEESVLEYSNGSMEVFSKDKSEIICDSEEL